MHPPRRIEVVHNIKARTAVQRVIAKSASKDVVTGQTIDAVGGCGTGQAISAG